MKQPTTAVCHTAVVSLVPVDLVAFGTCTPGTNVLTTTKIYVVLSTKFSIRKISVSMLPKVESTLESSTSTKFSRPEFAHAGPLRIVRSQISDLRSQISDLTGTGTAVLNLVVLL